MSIFAGFDFEQMIAEHAKAETDRIESDLFTVLGKRASWPHWAIRRLGYELAYQRDALGQNQYRGILRRNQWVVDHHPDWPFFP